MLSVQTNMLAWNASGQLNRVTNKKQKSAEKLSSGYKINRAADDAAGLAISEKMRRQIRGLHQGAENVQDGVGYVQTADGALEESQEILQRINELAIKAANDTNSIADKAQIDQEVQELKVELSRIFETTSFNDRKIWKPTVDNTIVDSELLGYKEEQAVTFKSTTSSIVVTNENCGVIALGSGDGSSADLGYHIHADQNDGVYIDWMGYDGNTYRTETISWKELKAKGYSFEMSDYFGEKTPDNKLYDTNGNPVFQHRVAFSVHPRAGVEDIVKAIDGTQFYSSPYITLNGNFEDKTGGRQTKSGVSLQSFSMTYRSAYGSNHNTGNDSSVSQNVLDFNKGDDVFLDPRDSSGGVVQTSSARKGNLTSKPSASTVGQARSSKENWEFSFYMDGIGEVTASSDRVSYGPNGDLSDDDEGYWWRWEAGYVNGKRVDHYRKAHIVRSVSEYGSGTLGDIMAALTGKKGSDSPGLLASKNGGDADAGGYIDLHFSLSSKDPYTYGNGSKSTTVGSFVLRISVSSSDTEETVFKRIQDALNDSTIMDLYVNSGAARTSFGTASANRSLIDVPVYGGQLPPEHYSACKLHIQSGLDAPDQLNIIYKPLSLKELGMNGTDVRTKETALKAIDEVSNALTIVSEQRSLFGAYQNRLEHTYDINKNTEENTQYAESAIRDTDMEKELVAFSNHNILGQAGVSMLAQANQQNSAVLYLLQ